MAQVTESQRSGADRTSGEDALERHSPPAGGRRAACTAHVHAQPGRDRPQRGCYHWTPEGRKLADFTSGVLVANWGTTRPAGGGACSSYLGLGTSARQRRVLSGRAADGLQRRDRARSAGRRAAGGHRCAASRAAARWSKCCGRPAAAKRFKKPCGPRWIAGRART